MDLLFPLLKKSGVDDRGHRLRITHTRRHGTHLAMYSQVFTNSVFPLDRDCKLNSRPWLFQKIKYLGFPNLILLLGNAKLITRENVREQCTQVILKTGYGKKRSVLLYWEPK